MTERRTAFAFLALGMVAVLAAMLLPPAAASGQAVCGGRAALVERLGTAYAEVPQAAGIAGNGSLVEVFAARGGSWSILVTRPGGPTCLIATGENWSRISTPFKDKPEGTRL